MKYKISGRVVTLLLFLLFTISCQRNKNSYFTRSSKGYWFKLLSFQNDSNIYHEGQIAWVNAAFKTQNDSLFYDTENDLKDRFFVHIDSTQNDNLLKFAVSNSEKGDSLCLLIKPERFFSQQFKSPVPDFSKQDTIVKIYLKIKDILTREQFAEKTRKITNNELNEIETFFGSAAAFESARDPLGFYWLEKPKDTTGLPVKAGNSISISYSGGFLNGRVIDVSPPNFQVIYGTPDQLLKGLNYVISRLKIGQTSKIILPSQLAFGESGSSNGSVPPYTPMLYQISINN